MSETMTPAEVTDPQDEIGDRIRLARKRKELQQAEVARALGVSAALVSKWENGHSVPDMHEGRELARLLGVSYGWLGGVAPRNRWFAASPIRRRVTDHDPFFQALLTVANQYGEVA